MPRMPRVVVPQNRGQRTDFANIRNNCSLTPIIAAGQGNDEEVEGLCDMGHCANRLSVIFFDKNIIRLVRIFAPYEVLL